jgi:nicotinamidase-related amidase
MNSARKTALVVVDFQGGPLDYPSVFDMEEQLDNAKALVAASREADIPVVWIQEVHKEHQVDIGRELDGSEGMHSQEGHPYTDIAYGLGPQGDEYLVPKRRYSSFMYTSLDIILKQYGVDDLILIGGFTDICVLYTAMDAKQRDFSVSVVTDCVHGSGLRAHDDALVFIANLQEDILVTTEEILGRIAAPATAA